MERNVDLNISLLKTPEEKSLLCDKILHALPEWFGIEEAIQNYINDVKDMETWCACENDKKIGFISLSEPNPYTAEIHVMGVIREWHRHGVGRDLVERAQQSLKEKGYKFLQVKTLSASRSCAEYDRTRNFYMSMGFIPVQEFQELWGAENPCLQLIKSL